MPLAILFDIDGCLISTGGAGTKAWRHAFDRLHGIPADIGQFTEAGMTDPDVGRLTFVRVLGREPTDQEMARLLGAYLDRLVTEVEQSPGYRIMPGVTALLPRLVDAGIMLGLEWIDDDHANAKRLWSEMGQPEYLSPEEVGRLQAASCLAREPVTWRYKGRTVDLGIALPPHGVAAITVGFATGQPDGATRT